jgi:VWFA-related protein
MRVRVSVLDSDWKPVAGFTKDDFKLFVDDQETEIASFETNKEPLNFVFMIDNSVSATMAIKDLAAQAERVLDALAPGDRASAVAFSEKFNVIGELTDDREKLRKAIRKAIGKPANGTSIYDHIQYLSTSIIPNISGPAAVILLTDGADTTSRKAKFDTSLTAAEASDAAYYVIYLDTLPALLANVARVNQNLRNFPVPLNVPRTDPRQLRQDYQLGLNYLNDLMALSGGHTAISAPIAGSKAQLSSELPAEIRSQYVVAFTPRPGSVVGQRHSLNVRVNRANLAVVARGSFIPSGN